MVFSLEVRTYVQSLGLFSVGVCCEESLCSVVCSGTKCTLVCKIPALLFTELPFRGRVCGRNPHFFVFGNRCSYYIIDRFIRNMQPVEIFHKC